MLKLSKTAFVEKLKGMKMLALDVDGVLTDDTIFVGPGEMELKQFHISDGFFMTLALRAGLIIAIVSGRKSEATEVRMKALGVKYILQGSEDKLALFTPLLEKLTISVTDVAYMGNELLDIPIAEKVGLPIAVAGSTQRLIDVSSYVTEKVGGKGAVREVLEYYFEAINKDPLEYTPYGRQTIR
ncbi:MAG: HAD hydrolase family protein [candidate division Zixibacteria bacterium]|nr:HAD hydrolase family protein [candidate division Zixibacteria bacterium]